MCTCHAFLCSVRFQDYYAHDPNDPADRSAKALEQSSKAGALRFLAQGILQSVPFQDDFPAQKELYAGIIHQTLMRFLDAPVGR